MIHIQPNMTREYWDRLQAELKDGPKEMSTWAIPPREGSFYARAASDRVFIEGKTIKGIRTIAYPEFEKLSKHYNEYLDGAAGVKQKMREELGYNTPYLLTLLHHAVEEAPAEEPEPEAPKKPQPERVVHYRPRPRRA